MLQLARVLASLWMLFAATGTHAQAPYPPQALALAPSVDAAVRSLAAVRPEFSGYLLLDVPEISLSGLVTAQLRSELPGTSQLVLLREFPVSSSAAPGSARHARNKAAAKPVGRPVPAPASAPPTVFVAAKLIEPGEAPVLTARFDFQRNERFTLLAYAQGRWFATSREIKLAKEVEAP